MKIRLTWLILPPMALFAAAPVRADAGVTSERMFLVKNNTNVMLHCRTDLPGRGLSGWFRIAPGGEWGETTERPGARGSIVCRHPVRQRRFPIRAGERYLLLRPNGYREVVLRRFNAD